MRKILVGQQPGNNNPPSKPLWAGHSNSTGFRIAMMAGLDVEEYHDLFERVNINHNNDFRFQVNAQSRAHGTALRSTFRSGDFIVAMGRDVCECLCLEVPEQYFEWKRTDKGYFYSVIPHPSGLNRFYNDKENWTTAEFFMRDLVAYPEAYEPADHKWAQPEAEEQAACQEMSGSPS